MASKEILVCGTLNLETTFPITGFPFEQSMRDLDVVWISNEPPDLLPDVTQGLSKPWPPGLFPPQGRVGRSATASVRVDR